MNKLVLLSHLWSVNFFADSELSEFANRQLIDETRQGLKIMCVLLLVLIMVAWLILNIRAQEVTYSHNYFLVMALAFHIYFSSRSILDIKTLHLLGMTLLIISAMAFVLIAHQMGKFSTLLIANIVMLFMVIPLIPWGLKEALLVIISIYLLLTISTYSVSGRFDSETLWALQFFLLGASVTSLVLVLRGTLLRKNEIMSHFLLKKAHDELYRQSHQDPLTGAWNRRFLMTALNQLVQSFYKLYDNFHFIIFDLDGFKILNDLFGHEFGDRVLRIASDTIRDMLEDKGYLIRIGGDEFVVLMVHDNPERFLRDCVDTIRIKVKQHNQRAVFNMSWGMVSAPLKLVDDLEGLYQQADNVLYENKQFKRLAERGLAAI